MVKPVGGRGHTAPYKTMVVRIPIDLQERVEEMVEKFRDDLEMGITSVDPDNDKISKLGGADKSQNPSTEGDISCKKLL